MSRPTRASLIATFGSWDIAEPLLVNLIQEAQHDLTTLGQALVCLDGVLTTQRLHRLMGSIAFLGSTGLESQAVRLIEQVNQSGVSDNVLALQVFFREVENYLQYLSSL